jgi:hypothetical protein
MLKKTPIKTKKKNQEKKTRTRNPDNILEIAFE